MVESRFRVANGMEVAVRDAFLQRPGLVDSVIGFLGMEVYEAGDDACTFHLVTRWTDFASYDTWHRSDEHRASHAGIPRGLKLDSAFTRLTVLNRIEPTCDTVDVERALGDAAPSLAGWLADAATTYVAVLSTDAAMATLTPALADRLGVAADEPSRVASLLVSHDADSLRERVALARALGRRGAAEDFFLNFVNAHHSPFTLRCRIDVQPHYVLLFAEDADGSGDALRDGLLQSNNQLAVLAREAERKRQDLDAAHRELAAVNATLAATLDSLETSYWHIQRSGEVLPVCLDCGDVETAHGSWQSIQRFLVSQGRSAFLSHGYCPPCASRAGGSLEPERRGA